MLFLEIADWIQKYNINGQIIGLQIQIENQIYNDWAKMIDMKKNFPVFKANSTISSGTTLQPKIYIYDDTLPTSTLKNVVVLSNFDVNAQNVVPNFPYIGTWYDLMTNAPISVSSTTTTINIAAGQFKIYGNQPAALGTNDFNSISTVSFISEPCKRKFQY